MTAMPTEAPAAEHPAIEEAPAAPMVLHEPAPREAAVVRPQMAVPAPAAMSPWCPDNGAPELFRALAKARKAFKPLTKKRTNNAFHSKYANLSDAMAAIEPALTAEDLVPTRIIRGNRVVVRLVHAPSAEWVEAQVPLALPDFGSDVQKMGSAITYAVRYALLNLCGVTALDEDDDGNSARQTQGARR